jgi:hypothetical protein
LPSEGFRFGKRAIAGIAAAALAVVLCSVGLAAAFRGEQPVARVAANTLLAPSAPAPVVAAPPAPPAPPASMTSVSESASSSDDAKTPAVGAGKGKKGKASKGGAKASFAPAKVQSSGVVSKKSEAPVSRAPKAADKCGCKGDFTCVLRCTATGK